MKIQRLEDGDFLIHMDCDLRSLSERKMFVSVDKDGSPKHPDLVPVLVRIGRSFKMLEMIASGTYASRQDLADVFGMSQSKVSRITRLAFLSPVIIEKVVTGQLSASKVMALSDQLISLPLWADQHQLLGID